MGRVKQFAIWLQECLSVGMSDEDILGILQSQSTEQFNEDHRRWVNEQINYLRNDENLVQPRSKSTGGGKGGIR